MKILIFTEGTILTFQSGAGLDREKIVELSKNAATEERSSVHDFANYNPQGNAVGKLNKWKQQGTDIYYLTSRRTIQEVEDIKAVLQKYNFPDSEKLLFRQPGEEYKDVAERLSPDVLIEDDCESIGGEKEMTYPHIDPKLRPQIKSVIVKEFEGIDHLPDDIRTFD